MSQRRPPQDDPESDGQTNGRKRRRIAVACKNCSTRKSRCDGREPKCSTCIEINADCVYLRPSRTHQSRPAESDMGLHSRLETIEQSLKQVQAMIPNLDTIAGPCEPTGSATSHMASTSRDVSTASSYTQTMVEADLVDGMGIMLADDHLDEDEDEDVEYFGISSNIALLRKVNPTSFYVRLTNFTDPASSTNIGLSRRQRPPSHLPRIDPLPGSAQRAESGPERFLNVHDLPPLDKGTELLRQFFSTVGMILPCFHEPQCLEIFRQASLNGTTSISRTMLATLNVMFAFSNVVATTSCPPRESVLAKESDRYYNRAIALTENSFDPSNLETVRLSLILSTYLMGTQQSVKSWNFHSLAVGGAVKLGLNSRNAEKSLSLLSREMRKRVWFWCVTNDRFLSMLFGRPPLIHQSLVNMTLPVNISAEYPCNISGSLVGSIVDHYSALIELSALMGEAVEKLYNQNLGCGLAISTEKLLASRLDLIWRLGDWRNALPPILKPITSHGVYEIGAYRKIEHLRLRTFITLRYKCVQVLINRAVLFKYMDYQPEFDIESRELHLLQSSGRCGLHACQEECRDLVSFVAALLNPVEEFENITLFGAWYFSCYYVFNAALTLLGILLVCRLSHFHGLLDSRDTEEMRKSLHGAYEVLSGLHNGNPVLLRCAECLSKLIQIYESKDSMNACALTDSLRQNLQSQTNASALATFLDLDNPSLNTDLGSSSIGGLGMDFDFDFIDDFHQTLTQ